MLPKIWFSSVSIRCLSTKSMEWMSNTEAPTIQMNKEIKTPIIRDGSDSSFSKMTSLTKISSLEALGYEIGREERYGYKRNVTVIVDSFSLQKDIVQVC